MFDDNMENNENEDFQDAEEEQHEEEWQQQLEKEKEGKIWDDRRLSDFDLLKGIMQSEYGNNEFSNSAELTETGDYDLNLERDDPNRENLRKRQTI